MHRSRILRFVAAATLAALLALLPLPAALAGGCCFTKLIITSIDSGRAVMVSGPALTAGYDLSSFGSFANFPKRSAAPARPGPAYEVDRDGWDHLRYYPGSGSTPGVVYYEGLYNGSSEYDRQWFDVTPAQDAALRQALAERGFIMAGGAAPPTGLPPLAALALAGGALLLVVLAFGVTIWRSVTRAAPAGLTVVKE